MSISTFDFSAQYLTFIVAGEEYAISILRVREILGAGTLTRIPRAPAFVRGVMNLRGSVVPVVDLRVKLALGPSEITPLTCFIVVEVEAENGRTVLAFIADEVNEVLEVPADHIEPAPSFGTRIDLRFLRGVVPVGERFALILDIDQVLSALEIVATAELAQQTNAGDVAAAKIESESPQSNKRRRGRPAPAAS